MSGFCGMDPEQVRVTGDAIDEAARRIEALSDELDSAVRGATWDGPDAESFRTRWAGVRGTSMIATSQRMAVLASELRGEADQQDITSEKDGDERGPAPLADALVPEQGRHRDEGYLRHDIPWLPDWIEHPAEAAASSAAQWFSDGFGAVFDAGMDTVQGLGSLLGLHTDGIDQFQRDAHVLGDSLTDLVTGERVPTVTEVLAGTALTTASAVVAGAEIAKGEDLPYMDDRTEVSVVDVTRRGPIETADDLAGLVLDNDEARREMFGRTGDDAFDAGAAAQIRVQQVESVHGGEPSYIVHVPPTMGGIANPDAWGAQGNPFGWDQNARLAAGQETASSNAVRLAMAEAGIPPGSHVMFVGHSQGGLVASSLAADPSFNNASGAAGSYDITHSFSVGSPVQTYTPAQAGTEVVNVAHGPLELGVARSTGDLVPALDFDGAQLLSGNTAGPNVHDVQLPATTAATFEDGHVPFMEANHESVPRGSDGRILPGGYYGSLQQLQGTDPTLVALAQEIDGTYMGPGTVVTQETVVAIQREDLR